MILIMIMPTFILEELFSAVPLLTFVLGLVILGQCPILLDLR